MATHRSDLVIAKDGEFAGWRTWTSDIFENSNGPFWHRFDDDGHTRCAMRAAKKHLNGMGAVHGGCLLTFADYCLFAIASKQLEEMAITVSLSGHFLDAAYDGELIVGSGEVVRTGGALIFLRGIMQCEERTLFAFSGIIRRVKLPVS